LLFNEADIFTIKVLLKSIATAKVWPKGNQSESGDVTQDTTQVAQGTTQAVLENLSDIEKRIIEVIKSNSNL